MCSGESTAIGRRVFFSGKKREGTEEREVESGGL